MAEPGPTILKAAAVLSGAGHTKDDRAVVIIGLTDDAIDKLKRREPVVVDLTRLFAELPRTTSRERAIVTILWEPTPHDFVERFAGAIDPGTIMKIPRGVM